MRNSVAAIGSTPAFRRRSGHQTIGIETAGLIHRYHGEGLFLTHNSSDTTSTRALSSTPQRTPGARCHGKHRFQVATTKEYPEKDFDLSRSSTACTTGPTPPERQRTFRNR
jgi:hypothetical protein